MWRRQAVRLVDKMDWAAAFRFVELYAIDVSAEDAAVASAKRIIEWWTRSVYGARSLVGHMPYNGSCCLEMYPGDLDVEYRDFAPCKSTPSVAA